MWDDAPPSFNDDVHLFTCRGGDAVPLPSGLAHSPEQPSPATTRVLEVCKGTCWGGEGACLWRGGRVVAQACALLEKPQVEISPTRWHLHTAQSGIGTPLPRPRPLPRAVLGRLRRGGSCGDVPGGVCLVARDAR